MPLFKIPLIKFVMPVTLSVATSVDGYIDDCSSQRLLISSKEDWEQVYKLRAESDAILIGGGTLRSDNPTLTLKSEELKNKRLAQGLAAEPARIIISGVGDISPSLRLFHRGEGRIIIFSTIKRDELEGLCEVIVVERITAWLIISEVERRGLHNIFVEGGEHIHSMFLQERAFDKLRVACNPEIVVGDKRAPQFHLPEWVEPYLQQHEDLGGVLVDTYIINAELNEEDSKYMEQALAVSHYSPKSEGCYSVGAVIVTAEGDIFTGYTGEVNELYHAEQAAIYRAEQAGVELRGATIYSTIEPCSQRSRQPKSCSQLIIERGFSRVCFALYEPSCFVVCKGALNLREAGIRVDVMDNFAKRVQAVNSHLLDK